MTKSAKQILIEARELIAPEEKWIVGYLARNSRGLMCEPEAMDAECWCSIGAIEKVCAGLVDRRKVECSVETILENVMGDNIPEFNDIHTHAEVLAAFDWAIAIA